MVLSRNDLLVISTKEYGDLIMQYYTKFGKAAPHYNPETYGTAAKYQELLKEWLKADKPIN